MQSRVESLPPRLVPDSFDYRLARAKLRAASGSASEQVTYFRNQLADRTVLRPREDVFGLAIALRRARDFAEAERELAAIRAGESAHPAFESLAAQLQADQGRTEAAIANLPGRAQDPPQVPRTRPRPRAGPARRGPPCRGHRDAR